MAKELKIGDTEVYVGSGNVFADLGLPDAEELRLKSTLAIEIRLAIKAKRLTRPQAALKLGMSKKELTDLLDGSPFEYSIDQLIGYLNCLGYDMALSALVSERAPEVQGAVQRKKREAVAI